MLAVSSSPSLNTTRCVTVSTLCQTTILSAGIVAGFGENDCAPLMPTTVMTTAPAGGVGESVGPLGDDAAYPPHAERPRPVAARAATLTYGYMIRILSGFSARCELAPR